ncbi:DUF3967 domain-containing protein [Bacilli bacterium]|nr:DUF3967 domain-containing protein [Bacilli bacterium]
METVEVLRFIAEGFKRKLTAIEIEDSLSQMFPKNIDMKETTAITTAVVQQQSENDNKHYALQLQNALEQMNATMKIIADQKEEITELRKHVADIEKQQQKQEDYINNRLKERDQKLMESLKEIQEAKNEIANAREEKKRGFFTRFFK